VELKNSLVLRVQVGLMDPFLLNSLRQGFAILTR
jgi:hypothetical protein